MALRGTEPLPLQVGTIRTDDGCRLWTATSGRGEPLVCCHGGPGLWDMLGDVGELLGDIATVHRWDQRGGGRSERRGPYSLGRFVADLDAVRQHFGLDRMALLGHSWGAQLALRYALDHPERVTKLVYLSGVGLGWAWRQAFEGAFLERLAPAQRAIEHAERMATPWFAINHECNRTINAELRRRWREPELEAACRALEVPTLILDGAEDLRPRWAVDSLERVLPSVTRVVIEDAGHLPWMEAPDQFRAAMRRFLSVR